MDWRGMLLENWPYKLAALVLAILLWFNVAAEKRQEQTVPTRLDLEVQDTAWVIASAPSRVQTTFQGRVGDIVSMVTSPPAIRRVIDSVTGPTMTLDLAPDMVSYNRDLKATPVAVHPSQVEAHLERKVERKVPVASRLELSAADGFALVRPVRLEPDSVTVRGARSVVETIDSLPTESATLSDLARSVSRELQVRPPRGASGITIEPGTVLVTVGVDSLVEATLTVPLELRGDAAGGAAPPRDSVAVSLRGARPAVRALDAASVRAFVTLDSLPEGGATLPVRVELPPQVEVTATPSPAEVTVRPAGAGS
ncbi:MAG TPA: CdaR family protein [Gemmatimonadota bacterium]|nr:CdaR family protein [Gemmatimonadota bacterium]